MRCGLSLAVGAREKGARDKIQDRGRLGVPLRLSETYTVSGEDTLEATPVG
jgi:hypothetical protein